MINLKKIVAVGLAAAMCMGMSVTSFAAPDPSNAVAAERSGLATNNVQSDYYYTNPESINNEGEKNPDLKSRPLADRGNTAAGKASLDKTLATINTKQEVLDILEANDVVASQLGEYVDLKDCDILPVASADVYALGTDGNYLAFKLGANVFSADGSDSAGKYIPGDTVLAMVESGSGTGVWRIEAGTVNKDGEVVFETNTTGAIVLIKAMKNGMMVQMTVDENGNNITPPVVIDPEKPVNPTPDQPGTSTDASNGQNAANANGQKAAQASAFTSPKTGEF